MTQIFKLRLATDTVAVDAKQLGVSPIQLQDIQVTVSITHTQQPIPHLSFTYYVQIPHAHLATQLNWPAWQAKNALFTDFLWEQTCLECFIASGFSGHFGEHNETTSYIEINASPSGHYALYKFESYRNPESLPPPPLLQEIQEIQENKKARAFIDWHNDTDNDNKTPHFTGALSSFLNYKSIANTYDFKNSLRIPRYCYQRSFSVPVEQLLLDKNHKPYKLNRYIKSIHPCVILQFGQTPLYYAQAHASPPDFHQRSYWSQFKY